MLAFCRIMAFLAPRSMALGAYSISGNRKFHLFSIYYRKQKNNSIEKIKESSFFDKYDKYKKNKDVRIIICLKENKKIPNIINKDIKGTQFGKLQKLMCAGNLEEMYKSKLPLANVQYWIKYNNKSTKFMYQMCYINNELKQNIKKDIDKYEKFGKQLGFKVYWKTVKKKFFPQLYWYSFG